MGDGNAMMSVVVSPQPTAEEIVQEISMQAMTRVCALNILRARRNKCCKHYLCIFAASLLLLGCSKRADETAPSSMSPATKQLPVADSSKPLDVAVTTSPTSPVGDQPPQPPKGALLAMDYDGGWAWIVGTDRDMAKDVLFRWQPETGAQQSMTFEPFLRSMPRNRAIVTAHGLMLIDSYIALITDAGRHFAELFKRDRERPSLLALQDGSVLVVGGMRNLSGDRREFINWVDRVSFVDGALKVEQLPDMPGVPRSGFALVKLGDERVMVLGGSSSQYVGSEPTFADTYILDLAKNAWSPGPTMREPRTDAAATVLPDGSVLVTGGWGPQNTWSDMPMRSSERWYPGSDQFTKGTPLPIGLANHLMMPGGRDGQVLVAGGMVSAEYSSGVVHEFDLRRGDWRAVGEICSSESKTGEVIAMPFTFKSNTYVWCREGEDAWTLVSLRLPASGGGEQNNIGLASSIVTRRWGVAFLPPQDNTPGLIAGGSVSSSETAAVDAMWLDGRQVSLAPLNHARRHAQVFRLTDGSILVAGGRAGNSARRTEYTPPMEILYGDASIDQKKWILLNYKVSGAFALGQLMDGSFLAFRSTGDVDRLILKISGSGVTLERTPFPRLNRLRPGVEGDDSFIVKELPNGRIIAVGRNAIPHRIALLTETALQPNGIDTYVGFGFLGPSNHYEIYDPNTKSWLESAPSDIEGGYMAILDDGRVVNSGRRRASDPNKPEGYDFSGAFEISSADGRAWHTFESKSPALIDTKIRDALPFVIDGELFLTGMHLTDVTENHARGTQMVQWYNADENRWESVWEADPNDEWRDHLGRIVFRQLSNGKRVAVPVGGLAGIASGA